MQRCKVKNLDLHIETSFAHGSRLCTWFEVYSWFHVCIIIYMVPRVHMVPGVYMVSSLYMAYFPSLYSMRCKFIGRCS